ncbi:MAG: hypothetical protein Q9214_005260 [Letrouitia sp. 1 TL-2023]
MDAVPRPPVPQEQQFDHLYQELRSGMVQGSHRASQPDRADKSLKRRPRSARRQESNRTTNPDEDYILLPTTDDSFATDMSVNPNNMFPSFLETPPNARLPQSPMASQQPNGNGGMNGMSVGMPLNAGHQMDVNMLYQKVLELSEVLRENREQTQGIVAGAEELAVRHFRCTTISKPLLMGRMSKRLEQRPAVLRPRYKKPMPKFLRYNAPADSNISVARIADLERQLATEQNKVRTILREQKENTKLIGEYETAVGTIVEMVRNYSFTHKQEKTSLSLHYNKLLQEEKDAHLVARLEKDEWHSRFMWSIEMLREAYKLRCEEEEMPLRVVAGLQNEVRGYRNALGLESEREEDEYGWEILKDRPDAGGGED